MPIELKPLISELEIRQRITQLAQQIIKDYDNVFIVVIVLKGAFVFAADLVRQLTEKGGEVQIDFLRATSYGNRDYSSGEIKLIMDLSLEIKDKKVLLVDDIIDTGLTISFISEHLRSKGAKEVRTCVLLDKPSRRVVNFTPNYIGFSVPDVFVVGYGIDYAENYRGLSHIMAISKSNEKG